MKSGDANQFPKFINVDGWIKDDIDLTLVDKRSDLNEICILKNEFMGGSCGKCFDHVYLFRPSINDGCEAKKYEGQIDAVLVVGELQCHVVRMCVRAWVPATIMNGILI